MQNITINLHELPTAYALDFALELVSGAQDKNIVHEARYMVEGHEVIFTVHSKGTAWMSTDVLDTAHRDEVLRQARDVLREWMEHFYPELVEQDNCDTPF